MMITLERNISAMHPEFLTIGSFTIRWYGVMAALGFLTALAVVRRNRRYAKLDNDQATNLVMLGMIAGVVGARIFYVVQNFRYYAAHPEAIIRIDQGGLVFYGGFLLATAALIFCARRWRADCVRVCDILTPALAWAHALGRVGCFLNGCCFGKPTAAAWAVVYPRGSEPFIRYGAQGLHPVQLYEALLNIVLGGVLLHLVRKGKRGVAMATYIFAYGILRFLDEFFRGDHVQADRVMGFTPAQVIGFALIPLGLGLMIYFMLRPAKAPEHGNEA